MASKRKLRDLQAECDRLEAERASIWQFLLDLDSRRWEAMQRGHMPVISDLSDKMDAEREHLADVNRQLVAAQAARDQAVIDPERPLLES